MKTQNNKKKSDSAWMSVLFIIIAIVIISIFSGIGKKTGESIYTEIKTVETKKNEKKKEEIVAEFKSKLLQKMGKTKFPFKTSDDIEAYDLDVKIIGYKRIEVIYYYRLINNQLDEIDKVEFRRMLQKRIKNNYCNDSSLEWFRNENVRMTWHYVDKYKEFIQSVSSDMNDCK